MAVAILANSGAGHSSFQHRQAVIGIYLRLRLLFILASVAALTLLRITPLQVTGDQVQSGDVLWYALAIFSIWSLVLFLFSRWALPRHRLALVDWLILLSLIPDGAVILMAARATGGADSFFYHSVYFLIAIHSYHLTIPGPKDLGSSERPLERRYFLIGALPAVTVAYAIYILLDNAGLLLLDSWIELGLQCVMATSFAWLGLKDAERSRELVSKAIEVEVARAKIDSARTTLERAKDYQESLLQALGRVTNIAEMQDEQSLTNGLNELAEKIGRTLHVEYCAVGLADEATVQDVGLWTSFELSVRAKDLLNRARVNPIAGSLIGSVLLHRRSPLNWTMDADGDILDPQNPRLLERNLGMNADAAAGYREILPGGAVRQMLLVPFYAPQDTRRPVGYLHLINIMDPRSEVEPLGFSEAHTAGLQAVAGQLAIAIENFRSRRREREEQEDERFMAGLSLSVQGSDIFGEMLGRLNENLNSRIASLWVPIEEAASGTEFHRKLVLRSVRVWSPHGPSTKDKELEEQLCRRGVQDHRDSYIGRYLDHSTLRLGEEVHFQEDLTTQPHCWSDLLESIGTPRLVLFPIPDPLATTLTTISPARQVLAVLCLRPLSEDFQLTPEVVERVRRFARHIEAVILEKRLRRRFDQIRLLKEGLERLPLHDPAKFYVRLVELVKEVMGAEVCSLFLRERAPTHLLLKATTAEKALIEDETAGRRIVLTEEIAGKVLYTEEDEGFTVGTFRTGNPILVYDSTQWKQQSRRFLEVSETTSSRSLLIAPVVDRQEEPIGVLQCVNQQEGHRLVPSFLNSDLELFVLLAGVASRFVESVEAAETKRRFLREITHELATPLLQAQTNTSFIEAILRREQSTKNPLDVVQNLRDTLTHLQAQVADIRLALTQPGAQESSAYRIAGAVDIHALVDQVRKPMLPLARSRAVEIYGHTAGMPAIYVDRFRMEQVLYNLVQNAVKYSRHAGPPIRISYDLHRREISGKTETSWHRIRVENTGIGVPVGEEELIFREDVRGSNTQFVATGQSGTGQGLPVARRIVERHGGILCLERRDNPTIFAILLPGYLERRRHE